MATALPSADLSQCGICLEPLRKPLCLPCNHLFCHECLESYHEDKAEILLCPDCKSPIEVPEAGVSGFTALETDEDQVRPQTTKDIQCGKCKQSKKKATVHCLDCKEAFCQACHDTHNSFQAMKNHEVIKIEHQSTADVTVEVSALMIATKDEPEQCWYHEEEIKKFFCHTCRELICKECIMCYHLMHKYTTLEDSFKSQSTKLDALVKSGAESKKKYKDAIQKTKQAKPDLAKASQEAKKSLHKIKDEFQGQLDTAFKVKEAEVDALRITKEEQIGIVAEELQTKLLTIDNVCDVADGLQQSQSNNDIASVLPTLSASLEEHVSDSNQLRDMSEGLGYIGIEAITKPDFSPLVSVKKGKQWVKADEFRELPEPWSIAVHQNGDLAITSDQYRGANIYSQMGQVRCSFSGPFQSKLHDIAATPDGRYIITGKNEILFFDSQGNRLATQSATISDMNNQPCTPLGLAVDQNGQIIVSTYSGWTFSIHYADGQLVSKFSTPADPLSHDITANRHIVATFGDKTVQLMDYSGRTIRALQSPTNITKWHPYSVCCTKQGEILVAMRGDPKAVYRYTEDGARCLGCVISECHLDDPIDLAITDDGQKLFVTEPDQNVVKVFQRQ